MDLGEFAPGRRFIRSSEFSENPEEKTVQVNVGVMRTDPREFLNLLHELGHVFVENKKGMLKSFYLKRMYEAIVSAGLRGEASPLLITDERNAWAEAIRIARHMRERRVNVLSIFNNADELSRWLRGNRGERLSSYESRATQEGVDDRFFMKLADSWFSNLKAGTANQKKKYS